MMHEPAKADIIIAHRSDDVATPPPVPPGPPAMMDHALIFLEGKKVEGDVLPEKSKAEAYMCWKTNH